MTWYLKNTLWWINVGVGKSYVIRVMSFLAEKILRQPGQDPNLPRVILAAPTGKAASIIGKANFKKESCKRLA